MKEETARTTTRTTTTATRAATRTPPRPAPRSGTPDVAESKALALEAVDAALGKKGLEPALLDLSDQGSYTDFLLVLSGRSDRHVQTIADAVEEMMAQRHGRRPIGSEGRAEGRWVLLDFGEVVVHVFYHPMRDFYDLEGLWCDAPRVPLAIPDDARIAAGELY